GLEHFGLFVAQGFAVDSGRLLHRQIRENLEEMILNDVANGARLIVESSAALDAKIFGHRDLHALDVIAIPERLHTRVRKAEDQQVVHLSLPQIVVDAKNVCFVKGAKQNLVEASCGFKITTERFFDDYTSSFGGTRFRQLFHDRSE